MHPGPELERRSICSRSKGVKPFKSNCLIAITATFTACGDGASKSTELTTTTISTDTMDGESVGSTDVPTTGQWALPGSWWPGLARENALC